MERRFAFFPVVLMSFFIVFNVFSTAQAGGMRKLREENEVLKSKLNIAQAQIADLEKQLQELQNELDMRNGELEKLYADIAQLEKNLQELGDAMQAEGEEMSEQFISLTEKKVYLEEQLVTLRSDIESAKNRNEELNELIRDYRRQINEKTVDNQNLMEENSELQQSIKDLQNSLTAETDSLSGQVADLTAQKQYLESQIAVLRKEIDATLAAEEAEKERMKSTYEQLVTSLEAEVGEKTIEIQSFKDALNINIMDKIFFDSGSATIKPGGMDVLRRVGVILKELPDKMIRVEGHTDDIPIGLALRKQYPNNWSLGAARATSVAEFLRKQSGIDPRRMYVVSYSQYRPLVPNTTEENRSRNRRIEIILHDEILYKMVELEEN
jgi:chemotaxis protein MotB